MSLPKSVVKFSRNNVTFTSSVDRAQYTIRELTRAALLDVGKVIAKKCNIHAKNTLPGWKKNKSRRISTYMKYAAFSYWVRKRECDLQIGIRHDTWYGVAQELGGLVLGGKLPGQSMRYMPKHGILRNTTYENIPLIREIEAQYLSAVEDELVAERLISGVENVNVLDD